MEETDGSVLLQMQSPLAPRRQHSAATQLLQTAQAITKKVNAGDDPADCSAASGAARQAVEAALPSIAQQHTHLTNQVLIAGNAVDACATREIDGLDMVTQQGTNLETERSNHATCRQTENELEGGLGACDQFEQLRNSLGNQQCVTLPDEDGWILAVENWRDAAETALNQGRPLQESCTNARAALAAQQTQCATAQHRFEEDYCAHRASCAELQICRANAEENYNAVVVEAQAALEVLHSEYQVMKHVECLLGMTDNALAQNSIISQAVIGSCSEPASTDELTIDYPVFSALTTCESTVLTRPPCGSAFFEAEYQSLAQRETIETACTECSALQLAEAPTSWLREVGIVDLDNLQPAEGSPAGCSCTLVELQGEYSGGPLVRCDDCLTTYRSTDPNSCPSGFKIFSPASAQDWETVQASVDIISDLRSPHFIVDVTRPENSCGGCTGSAMNSNVESQSSWVTSDGSPWFLRDTTYGEPNGDYTANCYLFVTGFTAGQATFNDGNCGYHSTKYLCQPSRAASVD